MDLKPRILDLYIVKKFIFTFFIALLLIIGIVIIFDISEKIDDFVSHEAPLKAIIFDYYLNFIPYFMNMFSPLFVFITVIFFTSKMAANSEIIAILSCGISFHRMMVPYMFSATLIAMFSLALNLFVIPNSNKILDEFESKYIKSSYQNSGRDVHYQISPGEFVYVESFSRWNNTAYKFTLEKVKDNRLVSKLSAETAVWDSTFNGWTLKKYFIRDYSGTLADNIRSGARLDTVINLSVTDFYMTKNTVTTLSYKELNQLIETQKMRGDDNVKLAQIEKHTRFALPFSAFILTVMGVSLSSKKRRGGIGWNIGIGIALSFSYILFLKFSEMFVHTDFLPPGIALWVPNILYAIISGFLYKIAPK
ncbi:MAG: LptF/LptG family permease [Bacteroidetes bacterium]|uniref:LptF/LptG family permease n=1 Tax=Candidatus Cryptobacteroides excrementipullorum TaxID=2840761 RepID=A0A9D9NMH6_9BACT|nr:LptF/LptG family permease [Candidatus Cryptobacteroides excrementipullorum]